MALRGTCIFTTARAATFVAAKVARVSQGRAAVIRRRGSLLYLSPLILDVFIPMRQTGTLRGLRLGLHTSLRSRLRWSRIFSTQFYNTALDDDIFFAIHI